MDRSARLQSARSWLKTYSGENTVAGYRKHFEVDWACALLEIEMLGVKVDPDYKRRLMKTVENHIAARARKKAKRKVRHDAPFEQNEHFAYIAGYTAAGFAYGVTWEEWERLNQADSIDPNGDSHSSYNDDSQELAF